VTEYRIVFARSARRDLEKMESTIARRVLAKIEELIDRPRPVGCRKLEGGSNLWRLRVGDYRVVYSVDDDRRLIDVVAVRHRREVYR
jgi:mRNA interferase RelE/StbE